MALTDELTVRPLTDDEILDVAGDELILAAQKLRAAYRKALGYHGNRTSAGMRLSQSRWIVPLR
jgi:hypothetical protein